ncbi:MAG: lipid A biosynthesis acyltransferase [Bacteroidetes bacterium]|nr:lipid A biosynthesis acyltransferase [Bacteroidota bacterium]
MYYILYPFLWLISWLPFRVLYLFSDLSYVLIYYGLRYRREVVSQNLRIAFPAKSEAERGVIAKQFYRNMIDAFVESIKFITISKSAALKRCSADFSILDQALSYGKPVYAFGFHQFNWEYVNVLFPLHLKVPFIGVYMPIANRAVDRIYYDFRKRFGTVLVAATQFKEKREELLKGQYVIALAADQNPGHPANAFWMPLFGKMTPFVTGPAKGAIRSDAVMILNDMQRKKRGHYHFSIRVIADSVQGLEPVALAARYRDELERVIRQDPSNYLWSHRRWKYDWRKEYGGQEMSVE